MHRIMTEGAVTALTDLVFRRHSFAGQFEPSTILDLRDLFSMTSSVSRFLVFCWHSLSIQYSIERQTLDLGHHEELNLRMKARIAKSRQGFHRTAMLKLCSSLCLFLYQAVHQGTNARIQ